MRKKNKTSTTGIVVRPILTNDLNQRGQVDLIDFQSLPDGEYKFILHYQEHLTKFSVLRPLMTKTAKEVAKVLFSIFLDFGAPHVLQSDNGREFTANIIKDLSLLWNKLVFVNGRPRHPQSQGSVERANATVKNSLVPWMRDNKTKCWSIGLPIIQWQLNSTYHEAIKMEPYTALFGQKPKIGLSSTMVASFLNEIQNGIYEEEILKMIENNDIEESNSPSIIGDSNLAPIIEEDIAIEASEYLENEDSDFEDENSNKESHPAIKKRMEASTNLELQSKKMLAWSNRKLSNLNIGDHVTVPVSQFDRGQVDSSNIIGIILAIENGRFKVGTRGVKINKIL